MDNTPTRLRGHYAHHSRPGAGYNVSYSWREWVNDPDGRMVRSQLEGVTYTYDYPSLMTGDTRKDIPGALHLPIFDIDQPIEVIDGMTLVFAMPSRRLMRNCPRRLFSSGLLLDLKYNWSRRTASATMSFPMEAKPSKTLGHFHLYVNEPMTMPESLALAVDLFGLVDPRHIRISRKEGEWMVLPATTQLGVTA